MTTITSLPAEIQRQCINYLDTVALKAIRLTSQAFRDIATEALFDVATLDRTEESVDKFDTIINNDNLRRYIRTLHLGASSSIHYIFEECYPNYPPKWWEEAVARWDDIALPNVKKILLDTAYACANSQCASFELAFAKLISRANVNTLTIKHLQDSCRLISLDIAHLPTVPKELHLLITTLTHEPSPDMDIELRHRHAFFNNRLNAEWLKPMQPELTHLTLHCNTYWGVYPRWQPGDLRFPALKSLAFGKWTIAFDWQIAFITAHAQTLQQLILTDCPILHASRMTPRQHDNAWATRLPGTSRGKPPTVNAFCALRWHRVLADFQRSLRKLRHFAMGRGSVGAVFWGEADGSVDDAFDARYGLAPRIDGSRYTIFDFGEGPVGSSRAGASYLAQPEGPGAGWKWLQKETDEDVRRMVEFPECLEEDQAALESLLGVLRGRV
ncbi:hypothetical protein C7974DRAFT_412648 [Boeremia exigua]|uniref:uncharacterized protein n=1 Tax=Boeremia exigua TaxID=749465 RepID=UPI001E8E3328|nr:uncharacterized protein C7974DRAFT_412648 [Boeremia exigua]KAH6633670.1 hypothetical protein C7974DRAFT_412648 [Boeremia exigua]